MALIQLLADDEGDDDDEDELNELRFIPDSSTSLEAMFKALSDCQLLHPDPNDDLSDEDEHDGGNEYDVDAAEHILGVGDGNGHMDSDGENDVMEVIPGQFEDAEPEM